MFQSKFDLVRYFLCLCAADKTTLTSRTGFYYPEISIIARGNSSIRIVKNRRRRCYRITRVILVTFTSRSIARRRKNVDAQSTYVGGEMSAIDYSRRNVAFLTAAEIFRWIDNIVANVCSHSSLARNGGRDIDILLSGRNMKNKLKY